ncbi:MAG: DUF1934 domain-containing protein [Gemmiger sp.]|nr:DUF1934 domain-containing protein [Gemmiger sp.]
MEENYLITITGTMERDGQRDSVELMTHGKYTHRDGSYYIVYDETEASGYAGCTTTVKIAEDARRVAMLRYGRVPGQLIIEKGTRHLCHYETGYGAVSLGVAADEISHKLGESGGSLHFSYTLDSGSENFLSWNLVDITVKSLPQESDPTIKECKPI